MTPRERLIDALELRPPRGRVPHFELVFYLTMEAFGKVHPDHRTYAQWDQMTESERQLHRRDMARLYLEIAERFEHSAILLRPNPPTLQEAIQLIDLVRESSGDRFFLMLEGDATLGIPSGADMMALSVQLAEQPQALKSAADARVTNQLVLAEEVARHGGLDGIALTEDYCFNSGPFLSPAMFSEFVTPYLARLIQGYRDLGFYTIKHTDGNIMPILDQLLQAEPHALHSLDPQAGVDIAEVKARCAEQLCLIGNVDCSLLATGSDEEITASARYALRRGMPGGGYIFSSSNCIHTGMRLEAYELMLSVWRREGSLQPEYPTNDRGQRTDA